jgi:hypothetical protein
VVPETFDDINTVEDDAVAVLAIVESLLINMRDGCVESLMA